MCRLGAYIGPAISLQAFLIEPPHNLIKQSWAPKEMAEAVLNADGFGFGWYSDINDPMTYLNTLPIWSDINLESLARSLRSEVWLGCVRSATPGQMTGLNNTQPFKFGKLLFVHNGYIKNFSETCKPEFNEFLEPGVRAEINGNTDSEYIFAVFRQMLSQSSQDIASAINQTVNEITRLAGDTPVLMNCIISNGDSVYALRHAINGQSPSLYYSGNPDSLAGGKLVASEPFNDNDDWQKFPDSHILSLSRSGEHRWMSV